jgi:hypothetical protein
MALPGQASGEWTESSGFLRELHRGVHNAFATLTADAFNQANPPTGKGTATEATMLVGDTKVGVRGGSCCFTRPDAGNNFVGGPLAGAASVANQRPLGVFINDALGHAFENSPGEASGQGPYMSSQGTFGNRLYETQVQIGGGAGNPLTYTPGDWLYASVNGLLTNVEADSFEVEEGGAGTATVVAILKHAPEADFPEMAYDQRI